VLRYVVTFYDWNNMATLRALDSSAVHTWVVNVRKGWASGI